MPSEQNSKGPKGTKVLEKSGPPSHSCPQVTQVLSLRATTIKQFHPETVYTKAEIVFLAFSFIEI